MPPAALPHIGRDSGRGFTKLPKKTRDSQTRTNARGAVTAPGAAGGAGAGAGTNTQVGVPGAKAGVKGQADTTGTLGAGGGAVRGAAGAAGKAGVGIKGTQ